MEDNCESGLVPSLGFVVEQIYSSCDVEKNDAVSASTLVDFVRPLMSNHPSGISEFLQILDPNDENPPISRSAFYEAMQKWTVIIEGSDGLSHFSFGEHNISDEKKLPFHQSTPKPSLEPSSQNMPNILNFSHFSATSFSSFNKSGSTVACENLVLEEKVKELEHKYGNALNELSMVKSQLTLSEEQYADLKQDLDRTNRRLLLEQQIIADLQKSIEHNDDIKEEIINIKKENEHLQKMWASAKKENSNLIASIRDLEYEKEQFERKMSEIRKNDDKRKHELADLQTAFALSEEENKALKKLRNELEDKVVEKISLLNHFTEMSEFMKNENQTLRLVVKKTGLVDLSDPSSMKDLPNFSPHGIKANYSPKSPLLLNTLKSSTPFKNMYQPSIFQREIFNSPHLISQLKSPVSSDGLDTPTHIRNKNLSNSIENSTLDSSKVSEISNGGKHCPKRDNSLEDSVDEHQNVSKKSDKDTPSTSLSSGNAVCETFEDLDTSIVSEKQSFKGQDLLSELQACKLLDNYDGCSIPEHEELSIIVKQHENCPKIIDEYKQQIEVLTKDGQVMEVKHQDLLVDHNNLMKNSKCLEELLDNEKNLNQQLALENFSLTKEVARRIDAENEKEKHLNELENKNQELKREIEKIKNKEANTYSQYTSLLDKLDSSTNEKIDIENQLEQMKAENSLLISEINHLHAKNKTFLNTIDSKDEEIQELHNVKTENENLKKEINNTKDQQIENCRTIENLTEKLEQSKNMGHHFAQIIKQKITHQKTKVEFLNELNMNLEKQANELKNELEHMRTELYLLNFSSKEITFSENPEHGVNMEDGSTSTEGSETNLSLERPQFRKRQSYIRKSNYEKQQLKIIKLEEQVEILQSELFNEKSKTRNISDLELEVSNLKQQVEILQRALFTEKGKTKNISDLESEIKNLKLEKINLEEEKKIISKQLDDVRYDVSLKGVMMKQFEESRKLEVDNLKKSFLKEKELMSANVIEAQQRIEEKELILKKQIEDLEKKVTNCEEEKTFLEKLLDKQETKIIALKKALSDITKSSEETKNFENYVTEKESMLQFSRELLAKSNNSLQLSENCVCSLNLLLDQCKVVLLDTVDDLFSATKEAFEAWKDNLKILSDDFDFMNAMKSFYSHEKQIHSEFTETKIEKINCNLLLSAKLLRALAQKSGTLCVSCKNNPPLFKGVNKFTLRPPKLQFRRFPSSDPDISSSCMKEGESPQPKDNIEFNIGENTNQNTSVESKILKQNDSITDWLGHNTNNLSVQSRNDQTYRISRSRDVSTETDNSDEFICSSDADFDIRKETQSTLMFEVSHRKSSIRMLSEKCSSFSMMVLSIICFLAMFLIYIHLECVRNGNGTIMCPLDFLVSVRRVQSELHPH